MRIYLLLICAMTGSLAHAACEDMYLWARMLQPGMCTPRTEFENRQIAAEKVYAERRAQNNNLRRSAALELTALTLAEAYGVARGDVSHGSQSTRYGYGTYSINNGQYVCEDNVMGGLSCVDTGGHYSKGLTAAQVKQINDRTWNASINEDGMLVAPKNAQPPKKKR